MDFIPSMSRYWAEGGENTEADQNLGSKVLKSALEEKFVHDAPPPRGDGFNQEFR